MTGKAAPVSIDDADEDRQCLRASDCLRDPAAKLEAARHRRLLAVERLEIDYPSEARHPSETDAYRD